MADEKAKHPDKIKISYIKSSDFREITCDGVLGGQTPQGKTWMAFYSERFPIPKIVEHTLTPSGKQAEFSISDPPLVIETREGIIRNMEFGVYMSLDVAERLRDWLTGQLEKRREG